MSKCQFLVIEGNWVQSSNRGVMLATSCEIRTTVSSQWFDLQKKKKLVFGNVSQDEKKSVMFLIYDG